MAEDIKTTAARMRRRMMAGPRPVAASRVVPLEVDGAELVELSRMVRTAGEELDRG